MLTPQASVKAWRDGIKAERRHCFTLSDGCFLLGPLTSERNGLCEHTGDTGGAFAHWGGGCRHDLFSSLKILGTH